jgi:hypothetical protein
MEIGAFFILIVLAAVVMVGGLLLYGVAAKLRRQKLHPAEDKLEGDKSVERGHPRHTRVANEQRAKIIADR